MRLRRHRLSSFLPWSFGFTALLLLCLASPSSYAQIQIPTGNRPSTGNRVNVNQPTSGTNSSSADPFANNNSSQTDTSATKGLIFAKETPDSVLRTKVFMFHYEPTRVKINRLWNPTLDPTGVQFSDPLDAFNGAYYLSKGILGQVHYNLFPTLAGSLDSRMQPDIHSGYAKRPGNVWFHHTLTPYSRLSYGSSLNKDYQVSIAHSQDIIPGWNASFDYRLYAPEGNYSGSGDKNHYLDANTHYFSRDARLQALAGIIWQSFDIDENGGLADDSYFTEQYQSNRAGIPVRFSNMGTRQRELAAYGHASYNLVRQTERYRERDSLALRTVDSIQRLDTLRIVDTLPAPSPHVFNAGVFAIDIQYDRRKRVFADSTRWVERSATLYWTNDAYMDHRWHNPAIVTLGIRPQMLTAIVDADTMTAASWLNPFARLELAAGHHNVNAEAEQRTAFNNQPTHRYNASYIYAFDSLRQSRLLAEATVMRRQADARMIHDYDGTLTPIDIQQLHLAFNRNDRFDLSLMATRLNHHTWYDSTLAVRQGQSPFWVAQAALTLRLAWGWMHVDMQQLLQYSSDADQLPLPLWASKNSLYADVHLFHRALRLQAGVDIRYHTAFLSPAYDPYTGLFYQQSLQSVGNYLWGDVFINIQVKRASIYAKAGHLNALWESHPNYFLLPHYPGQKFGLFWGITWHFFD